jgi:tetratricopeptide (TPR) repeat protein
MAAAPHDGEPLGAHSGTSSRWLFLPAIAGASSAWLPALTAGAGSTATSGTADDLVRYLSAISLATPLLYAAMLASAFLLAWKIARAPSSATSTGIRAMALAAGLLVAIPLSITPSRADDISHVAASFELQQHWLEATIAYREASRMQPNEAFYETGLGRSLTQQALASRPPERDEHLRNARAAFERAYALNPADPDHTRHLASLLRISASMLDEDARRKPLEEADRLYAGVTGFVPGLPVLWIEWGHTDADRQRFPEALDKAARALALDDARVDGWLLRGRVHASQDNAAEALGDYDRALSRDPRALDALRGRAVALAGLGRRDEALATVDGALALAPADAGLVALRTQIAR